MTMTRKLYIDNGLQDLKTEHQAVTACIVHLANSADIKNVAINKICSGLTGSYYETPNDTIHANRYVQQ